MAEKLFRGVYAAVLTPRAEDGNLDIPSLRVLIGFLLSNGIRRFAVNGATGEFCLTSPDELRKVLETILVEGGEGTEILCGVGAAGITGTKALVRVAEEAKVHGLLLPMPYFFPYSQDDLDIFCRRIAESTPLPTLLYNLPQFTSRLDPETACRLIAEVPTIVGVKDSSGSLDMVTMLTHRVPHACRIMGNDSALPSALQEGLCDGVVSGVACILPELISAFFDAAPGSAEFRELQAHLKAVIDRLNVFPTPWGLKWAAEARGVLTARFALPLSQERKAQAQAFGEWLRDWLPQMRPSLPSRTNQ